jgi:hypothetical protein
MSRAVLTLANDAVRARAIHWIENLPEGSRVEFKSPRRSLDQNAKMWAMLSEVSIQVQWHGIRLSTDDWKIIFLDSLKREVRIVPNIDGNGFVNLGRSSSDLSKDEMADLITLIEMFGANHSVVFRDDKTERAA